MAGRGVVEDEDRVGQSARPDVRSQPSVEAGCRSRALRQGDRWRWAGSHVRPHVAAAEPRFASDSFPPRLVDRRSHRGNPARSTPPPRRIRTTTAIARARAAMKDGTLMAILWHQGESDSNARCGAALRTASPRVDRALSHGARQFDTAVHHRPARPLRRQSVDASRMHVDSVHRALAAQLPNVAFVSADGLKDKGDNTHFTAAGARELVAVTPKPTCGSFSIESSRDHPEYGLMNNNFRSLAGSRSSSLRA